MKNNKKSIKGNISLIILSLLRTKPMHGYELAKAVSLKTNNLFTLREGTMYPVLHKLEGKGLIKGQWEETDRKRKRKYYHITPKGKKNILEKKKEWKAFLAIMNLALGVENV